MSNKRNRSNKQQSNQENQDHVSDQPQPPEGDHGVTGDVQQDGVAGDPTRSDMEQSQVDVRPEDTPSKDDAADPSNEGKASDEENQQTQVEKQSPGESDEPRSVDLPKEVQNSRLREYIADMAPNKPQDVDTGVANQMKLYRTIQAVLNQPGDQFRAAMDDLMLAIRQNRRGVFDERYAFRFFDELRLDPRARKGFERLLNLLLTMGGDAPRDLQRKQVDVDAALRFMGSEEQKQRLMEYFGFSQD